MKVSLKCLAFVVVLNFVASSAFGYTAEDYYTNGITKAAKGDSVAALVLFNKAIELNPQDMAARTNRDNAEKALSLLKK